MATCPKCGRRTDTDAMAFLHERYHNFVELFESDVPSITKIMEAYASQREEAERQRSDEIATLKSILRDVPDPEYRGRCSDCGRLEIITVKRNDIEEGYETYIWKHKPTCWYGRIQQALGILENR